jgi:hypothetical protein
MKKHLLILSSAIVLATNAFGVSNRIGGDAVAAMIGHRSEETANKMLKHLGLADKETYNKDETPHTKEAVKKYTQEFKNAIIDPINHAQRGTIKKAAHILGRNHHANKEAIKAVLVNGELITAENTKLDETAETLMKNLGFAQSNLSQEEILANQGKVKALFEKTIVVTPKKVTKPGLFKKAVKIALWLTLVGGAGYAYSIYDPAFGAMVLNHAQTAQSYIQPYMQSAQSYVQPYMQSAQSYVQPYMQSAQSYVQPYMQSAQSYVQPMIDSYYNKAATPVVDTIATKCAETLKTANWFTSWTLRNFGNCK